MARDVVLLHWRHKDFQVSSQLFFDNHCKNGISKLSHNIHFQVLNKAECKIFILFCNLYVIVVLNWPKFKTIDLDKMDMLMCGTTPYFGLIGR